MPHRMTYSVGGKGGYSIGYYNMNSSNKIYIAVGEFYDIPTTSAIFKSTYNGGGYGQTPGGGATSITTKDRGELFNFENFQSEVLLVAGGGGGEDVGEGGYGGGSGHVGNVTNGQTIAGNQTFPKPGGGTETGHTGNGYCIITWHPSL